MIYDIFSLIPNSEGFYEAIEECKRTRHLKCFGFSEKQIEKIEMGRFIDALEMVW